MVGVTDTSEADELAALRARAFGRNADIHSDPEALQRLRQLETAVRRPPSSPTPPSPRPNDDMPDLGTDAGTDTGAGMPFPDTTANASAATPASALPAAVGGSSVAPAREAGSPWRTRLWIVGVAAAAAAGALIGVWAANHDPTVVAVLSPAAELGVPDSLAELPGSGDATRFEDYLGAKIITYTFDDGSETPASSCIAIEAEAGDISGGCATKSLDAITHLDIREDASDALLAVHESGTSLRLTHTGDRIEIRSSAR
jgi:hypothetical protein